MANPAESEVQNLLPVQAYFDAQGNFQTFIGQNKPFYATPDPQQSGLQITNSTINSSVIGGITPAAASFTTATVLTQPVGATDVVNLLALQSYAAGISWKQPCVAATLTNITLSGLQTIDGHPVTAGNRVLVKNQGTPAENGIYIVSANAWSRSEDANSWDELICAISFIEYGTQAGGAWFCTAQDGGTLGVTAVNWSQFTTSATYTAGTGLTLTGTVFSITPVGTASTYGSASTVPVFTTNASGQVSSVTNTNIAIGATQITSGTIDSARLSGAYTGITGLGTLVDLTVINPIIGSLSGNASTATSLSGGAAGSLPYQTATNTTGFLAASTDGYILSLASGVPTWIPNTVGTVTAVTASAPLASSGGSTPNITITQAGTASNGFLSSTDWNIFNGKANSGANSDITSMTGLTGGISSPTFIQYGNGAGTALVAGKTWYDATTGAFNIGMGNGNITQQVGEELFVYGKATAAVTDSPLQCVYQTGTVGASGVITFAPTVAGITDGESIIGIATENIALNGFGRVTAFGTVRGITTDGAAYGETWADGDKIWYNPVTGGLTKNKPVAPNIKVQVGIVINAGSGGSGSFSVELAHGSELGGTDSNVQLSSPTNGNILSYDGGNGYWKNTSLTAGTGISVSSSANGVLTIANTLTAGITITDDTTTNATRYLTFTSATSGSITGENVSSTKLQFNPSTGVLTSTSFTGAGTGLTGTASSLSIGGNAANVSGVVAIANGGTGQTTATAAFNALNPMTTTGDIIYEASATTAARLPIGTTGQILTVSGGIPAWTNPSAGITWQTVKTSNFTAVANEAYPVNTTSGAITVTLPASPTAGQIITITDYAGTFATNNCTLNPNGNRIQSSTANSILNSSGESAGLVYIDATQGWIVYYGFNTSPIPRPYSATYLTIAGGAGGGGNLSGGTSGAGGGAGGYRTGTETLNPGTVYTVTVGAGGAGGGTGSDGTNGANSVFSTITSTGGGGGGGNGTNGNGVSGGSGGGTNFNTGTPGSGTAGQGNNGGLAESGNLNAGGGGGAGAVGGNASGSSGGNGGNGTASSITGSSVTRAGGGGGGAYLSTPGSGGSGGGAVGASQGTGGAGSGTANTGGGGGGGARNSGGGAISSGNGGSGVVILSIPTVSYSGTTTGSPTVTTSGSNTILTYTASGTYTG